ncbi:helix-turn-helix domain-containing protein [uncultured Flavonifractor sp.]|uniref:helix-turn-helix domain-containing protein n=1 Tax=uncultured Flavonifractor sp. TaxID=1193534 RepID=UPI00260450F6|nr:helix-turn-helix transcriptional regulator [uncultured Flavonifractor sp.]
MNIEIADRLVALRRAHGHSQEELAARLGVSRQAVSKWERAESSPDTDNLIALARLYGVSLDELLLQAARPEESAEARESREVFEAAQAWEEAEDRLEQLRKKKRAARKEKLLWLLTLALMVCLPTVTHLLSLDGVYAVVITVVYLITGFLLDNWHPGWMLYLTIPLYYALLFGK